MIFWAEVIWIEIRGTESKIFNNLPYTLELAWYAEFLLEIDLEILPRKNGERLNLKIELISLYIDLGHYKGK
jgi:hypothetical protein